MNSDVDKMPHYYSTLLYYGENSRLCAGVAKWYGGRLENGYAQACRGSNPFPGVSLIYDRLDSKDNYDTRN